MNGSPAIWTRPALCDQVQRRRHDGQTDIVLAVADLSTAWQALRLEQFLRTVPGMRRVDVDRAARRVRLTRDASQSDIPRLLDTCRQAGLQAEPLHRDALDDEARHEADQALKRLLVAGIFGMQAMMFALVLYLDVVDTVDATTTQLFRWLGLLAATPVVCYAAVPFFRHALADLRAGRPGIDVPVALAVVLIYAASLWTTLQGHGETWFDSVSMLVFVLLLGRYLELRARHRHQAMGLAAAHAVPLTANRRGPDGTSHTVAVAELVPGDHIHVAEGSVVPVDGLLVDAEAHLDASLHSGESRTRTCRRGDPVAAGCVAMDGPLQLRVSRTGASSSLTRLHTLTRNAQRHQAAASRHDAAVPWFIGGILTLAAATLAFWLWRDPARAFDATVAVLVVACPCAFALAAPATLTRAMAMLARRGVRVTRPQALAAMARADRAMFDKTGTLTRPHVDDADVQLHGAMPSAAAWRVAVALARESSHPLARALARPRADLPAPVAEAVSVVPGHGIEGRIDARCYRLGRPPAGHTDDGNALWLSDDTGPLAAFRLDEVPRPGARGTCDALREDGIAIELSSGDAPQRAAALAARLGIRRWHARQLPRDKHARVRRWQEHGHTVLVVGDGNNDAAALAAADVSASLVGATDLARQHTDLLLEDRLGGLVLARRMARRARRTLRQNRGWGLAWNLLAVPFAAMGMIPPWLAALGMSTSSLIVVLNVLRMRSDQNARPPSPDNHPARLGEHAA